LFPLPVTVAPLRWRREQGATEPESEPVTNYDLAFFQRLREKYEARWGEPGFDEQKLLDMISGCARRRILRDRTDLTTEQEKRLQEMIDSERADLWS
jgi:hypothetical protein